MHLSIIIPTRDRRETLRRTLDALAGQRLEGATAELLLVDDGSRDGTADAVEAMAPDYPLALARAPRRGARRERRAQPRAASGDRRGRSSSSGTTPHRPTAGLLAGHAALHAGRPEPGYAVLGHVDWAPALAITPLMRWLELHGQFAFAALAPGPAAPEHFYTAHVSAKRAFLLDAGGFDERLPFLFEDADLGVRLATAGLELEYRPELVVHHDHAITLPAWIERQERAGRAGRRLRELRRGVDPRVVPDARRLAVGGGTRAGAARGRARLGVAHASGARCATACTRPSTRPRTRAATAARRRAERAARPVA